MITTSDSPEKGSGTPNQLLGDLLHTIAMSGLSHVRTELLPLLVIPPLAPHPVQANGQLTSHGNFGGLSSSPHQQVVILAAPFWQTAHCNLRRFHQQETHDRTSLFGDVPQAPPIPARLLQRHQSQIAGNLLSAAKAFRLPDDQHERQGGESTHSGMGHQTLCLWTLLRFSLDRLT